jgi:aerobic carbon-monoxide dehydrogenase medium subunit
MKHGLSAPGALVDLGGIDALRGLRMHGGDLVIGAMSTHAEVARSPLVREHLPALAQLAGGIGDAQVRHRGTIGGSVANNDPAADYPAALLALGATVLTNQREIVADDFFRGLYATALEEDELITAVRLRPPRRAAYEKFANQASRYATVGVFVAQPADSPPRVAVTGAGCHGVFRLPRIESALGTRFSPDGLPPHGIALDQLMSDLHADAEYRSHLIGVITRRAVAASLGMPIQGPRRHGGGVSY